MRDIKIAIATHKPYRFPDISMYFPLQVGAAGKENLGYITDDTGDNISRKNANYCELTGIYWMWKNLDNEYIGLSHYRRHFRGKKGLRKWTSILNYEDVNRILEDVDIILPKKRNYYIESNYSQYIHAHHQEDLIITREAIKNLYPSYLGAYDSVMKKTSGHRYNMFIMKSAFFREYCEWLFNILNYVEERLDISSYTTYDKRVFGFISERLLDVWIEGTNRGYAEIPVMFMEKQNWITKGGNFLKRKFLGKQE